MIQKLKDNAATIAVFTVPAVQFAAGVLIVLARNGRL